MSEKEAKKESRVKLKFIRDIEIEIQKQWEQEKIFEADPIYTGEKKKYMGTFPYPYMNGCPHLGHTFTLTKVEFATQYERLKGKNILFPFGFHCTGMPIKAAADKLKRVMEEYGVPPKFLEENSKENKKEPKKQQQITTNDESKSDPLSFHAAKSKAKSKSGGGTQWHIMRDLGIPEEEIPKFADAEYWCHYFPKKTMNDLKMLGVGVDWRRSFITTEINPYYDSFIRWQFLRLNDKGKLQYGKRYTIYSAKDGQPCADHDRASGEGVLPQEFTLIKLELIKPFPEKLRSLESKKVFLVPGTLRPETMYGQTNCWILPDGEYGAFEINDTEVFICTERAAKNLSFQNFSKEPGKTVCLKTLTGWDLLGAPCKAPFSKYPVIYVLPLLSILPNKGTGIVTSVPSDAPDDYAGLEELRRKPAFRAKFNIKDHMVLPYDIIPIINIPTLGTSVASSICSDLKIKSPNDKELLEQAKKIVYEKGFYEGTMIVGKYKGRPVSEAKPLIRQELIQEGLAIPYSEPEKEVISRSGDVCVVALTDQWFLDYGETSWRNQVEEHLKTMELYSNDARNKFEFALSWLNQWACSRTYGLGTHLPVDERYLIESLSDSTIYMAYYTIAHYIQGNFDGSKPGSFQIPPNKFTPEVWDYIFLNAPYPKNCGIQENFLQTMRNEFNYWYPMDLRVSGKDLINNHLVFCLYNHVAFFNKNQCPRAMRANGHIFLNGEKMSKSTGNFLTLTEGVENYSADGMRIILADGGDSLDDANFDTEAANRMVTKLWAQIKWCEEALKYKFREESPSSFLDKLFDTLINTSIEESDHHYKHTDFREALRTSFYDLQAARDQYQDYIGYENMNGKLIRKYIEVQALLICPIAPHFAEYLWKMLGNKTSVRKASFPVSDPIDPVILKQNKYLKELIHNLRLRKESLGKTSGKKLKITVAKGFPEWQEKILSVLRSEYSQRNNVLPEKTEIAKILMSVPELKKFSKKLMPFASIVLDDFKNRGIIALQARIIQFDEKQFILDTISVFKKALEVEIEVDYPDEKDIDRCEPGKPLSTFY